MGFLDTLGKIAAVATEVVTTATAHNLFNQLITAPRDETARSLVRILEAMSADKWQTLES